MIVTLRPVGRGNWRPLVLVIHRPAQLFPELRDGEGVVAPGQVWELAGRKWRIVEVSP